MSKDLRTVTLTYNYGEGNNSLQRTVANLSDANISKIETFMDQKHNVVREPVKVQTAEEVATNATAQ